MYATIATTSTSGLRRNRNLTSSKASGRLGPVSMTMVLVVIVGVLALLYLTQITKTSVYGYQVSNLSEQRKELITRGQQLQVEAARLQSIANISERRVVGALQPETSPQFINP